jgi:hypothetical protein
MARRADSPRRLRPRDSPRGFLGVDSPRGPICLPGLVRADRFVQQCPGPGGDKRGENDRGGQEHIREPAALRPDHGRISE